MRHGVYCARRMVESAALLGRVWGIATRAISTHLAQQAGFTAKAALTGAVTVIQRFGSALNLNIHFHMLFLDGVYVQDDAGQYGFHHTPLPTIEQLHSLLGLISERVARFLQRRWILERDEDNSDLMLDGLEEDPLKHIHRHSVTCRVAIGPRSAARSSRCRPSRRSRNLRPIIAVSPTSTASARMPAWPRGLNSATRWNGCAAISQAAPSTTRCSAR